MTVAEASGSAMDQGRPPFPDASAAQVRAAPRRTPPVTYLILDDQRRVDVLNVLWMG